MPDIEPTKLIQILIDEANQLPHRDEDALYALRRRAEMIIRNVFSEGSKYLKDLEAIRFTPTYSPAEEDYKDKLWLSGKLRMLSLFRTMLEEATLFSIPKKFDMAGTVVSSNRIFVVHGRDETMKQSVARTLEQLGLEPIILHERPSRGKTVIEKVFGYSDVSFAVVLLSPDDMAYPKRGSPKNARARARQNVIFELGFFLGRLGRDRVVALYQKARKFELPSDYSGVLYILFDQSGSWQLALVNELKASGFNVDANRLLPETPARRAGREAEKV